METYNGKLQKWGFFIYYILRYYDLDGDIVTVEPYGNGLVNKTFLVTTNKTKYILQEINANVFTKPHLVMHNIELVTDHLRKKGNERSLKIVKSKRGKSYLFLKGKYYRIYNYIENTTCFDKVTDASQFYEVGKAVGKFQKDLIDFDVDRLAITIPDFHNTPHRFEMFLEALKADVSRRATLINPELKFLLNRYQTMKMIQALLEEHKLPKRVTHNDTKLNNVRFDTLTKEAVCLVDLDTVMAGSVLYDFGDAIRIGAASTYEDEQDLSKMTINLSFFEAFTRGFLETAMNILTPVEIDNLANSVKVITLECGMRFLTDFLNGDTYFRTEYPLHNLIRARAQFKLLQEIENNEQKMKEIVKRIADELTKAQASKLELSLSPKHIFFL